MHNKFIFNQLKSKRPKEVTTFCAYDDASRKNENVSKPNKNAFSIGLKGLPFAPRDTISIIV
ncbi:hypothetical protein [Alloprevotella tannerae]